jgi:N-acetylmuramoyl-L-alanine amidase
MRLLLLTLLLFIPLLAPQFALARAPQIIAAEIRVGPDYEQFILSLSDKPDYKFFFLKNPYRLVIDLPPFANRVKSGLPKGYIGGMVKKLRFGKHADKTRVVLDLKTSSAIRNSALLIPDGENPFRLVVEIMPSSPVLVGTKKTAIPIPAKPVKIQEPKPAPKAAPKTATPAPKKKSNPIIVIDAGHGGKDPGAIGVSGVREKDITLRYTKTLKRLLEETGRYNVVLTRSDDRYLFLHDRVKRARKVKGDIFISLHADSASPGARGLSAYTLSDKSSDKLAARLAERENKADIIGGLDLSHQDEMVADILIDLTRRETKEESSKLADLVLAKMRGVKLLGNSHRFAGFAVLKAPDIPSVLIELGFLSNKHDEQLLQTRHYQYMVINGIVRGIDAYFAKRDV